MVEPRPLEPSDPARLGGHRLLARLGAGGQGVVYLGRPEAGGAQVAIKLLHAELTGDADARARFVRELALLERVAGFCTAQVLGAELAGARPYIVSEYVRGPSLRAAVLAHGPRSGSTLDRLAVGTATALTAIHRAGVVHRDLKPHNVLLGPDGPRVIDFGIARALDARATAPGPLLGTAAYLAPEQIDGSAAGPAADLFAWAATLLFAATGRDVFAGGPLPVVLHRILHTQPDLRALPPRAAEVAAACLAKDPRDRPDAETVLLWLLAAPTPSTPRPTPRPPDGTHHDRSSENGAFRDPGAGPDRPAPAPAARSAWGSDGQPFGGGSGRDHGVGQGGRGASACAGDADGDVAGGAVDRAPGGCARQPVEGAADGDVRGGESDERAFGGGPGGDRGVGRGARYGSAAAGGAGQGSDEQFSGGGTGRGHGASGGAALGGWSAGRVEGRDGGWASGGVAGRGGAAGRVGAAGRGGVESGPGVGQGLPGGSAPGRWPAERDEGEHGGGASGGGAGRDRGGAERGRGGGRAASGRSVSERSDSDWRHGEREGVRGGDERSAGRAGRDVGWSAGGRAGLSRGVGRGASEGLDSGGRSRREVWGVEGGASRGSGSSGRGGARERERSDARGHASSGRGSGVGTSEPAGRRVRGAGGGAGRRSPGEGTESAAAWAVTVRMRPSRWGWVRTGLGVAGALAVADVAGMAVLVGDARLTAQPGAGALPVAAASFCVLAVVTLVAVVLGWRGSRAAAWTVVAVRSARLILWGVWSTVVAVDTAVFAGHAALTILLVGAIAGGLGFGTRTRDPSTSARR